MVGNMVIRIYYGYSNSETFTFFLGGLDKGGVMNIVRIIISYLFLFAGIIAFFVSCLAVINAVA